MSNLVISGYYGSKNAGDEAMLSAMLEVLRERDPQLNITVISSNPEYTSKRHRVQSIGWLDIVSIIKALCQAKLLISGGGSLLQNITSGRSLYYYMGILLLAKLCGCKVMLYAQGIGPIYGKIARWCMRLIGNRMDMITVRDQDSVTELEKLQINNPPIEVTADPVLAIKPVSLEQGRQILERNNVNMDKQIIAISVRKWLSYKRYKFVLAQVADELQRDLDVEIVFMPMQYPDDIKAAEEIVAQMKHPAHILRDDFTTAELLSIVGNTKLMVGIRLHALIFASVMNIPMIGISYDPKIDRFLKTVNENTVGNIKSITTKKLKLAILSKLNTSTNNHTEAHDIMHKLCIQAENNANIALKYLK